jgi:hypothetical protein
MLMTRILTNSDRKKVKNIKHDGNITLDEVIEVAKKMRSRSMARKLSGTVKEMLGTARSLGCTVGCAPQLSLCSFVREQIKNHHRIIHVSGQRRVTNGHHRQDQRRRNRDPRVRRAVRKPQRVNVRTSAVHSCKHK